MFGPITSKGKPSKGGIAATNRKVIDRLLELGVEVDEFPHPEINAEYGLWGKIKYSSLLLSPFHLLRYIRKKNTIIHITPVGGILMYLASYTIWWAKLFHIPCVVDLHAGTFFVLYDENTFVYRLAARSMLYNASAITVEGTYYKKEIEKRFHINKEIMYFPTMAVCSDYRHIINNNNKYNLFYFGRITVEKGLDTMLSLIEELDDRFHLYLDGFISPTFNKKLLEHPKVDYLGVESREELVATMRKMAFFLFPTRHKGEGQANSLVEAMEAGLIPVTSDQGFCKDVVAGIGKVLPKDANLMDYKKAIYDLLNKDLQELSGQCQQHIRENHNVMIQIPKLLDLYKRTIHK